MPARSTGSTTWLRPIPRRSDSDLLNVVDASAADFELRPETAPETTAEVETVAKPPPRASTAVETPRLEARHLQVV